MKVHAIYNVRIAARFQLKTKRPTAVEKHAKCMLLHKNFIFYIDILNNASPAISQIFIR